MRVTDECVSMKYQVTSYVCRQLIDIKVMFNCRNGGPLLPTFFVCDGVPDCTGTWLDEMGKCYLQGVPKKTVILVKSPTTGLERGLQIKAG